MYTIETYKARTCQQAGFTLMELLIVVSVMAVLAAVTINIIDPGKSRDRAQDATRYANIKDTAEGIESYRLLEGSYPTSVEINDPSSVLRTSYLSIWDGSINYALGADGFIIYTNNSLGECYKYQTNWGKSLTCPATECNVSDSSESACN